MPSRNFWPQAIALTLLAAAMPAAAQTFPDRPLKLLIGFAPGSSADVTSRIIADEMGKALKQPVIVEIRAGAASNIAADAVIKSAPDGYTMFLASAANVISRAMKQSASVDIGKELKAVALLCAVPNILVVNNDVKATNVKELIALAKAEPGKLNYGSPGPGTIPHLSGELFNVMAGAKTVHVAYKGTAQAAQDVLGGTLHMMFAPSSTVLELIAAKSLRALAWTITTRGPALPDLPTMAETLPGFDTSIWFGLNVPAGTPDPIRDRLAGVAMAAARAEPVAKAFRAQGIEPLIGGPAQYAKYIADESAKWSDVVVKAALVK